MATFVREFFGKIDQFHDGAHHPKWEVVISAAIPGWIRLKPAAEWIAQQRAVALRPTFDRFIIPAERAGSVLADAINSRLAVARLNAASRAARCGA